MDKNKEIAERVLAAVGGKDNIDFVTHCVTRLRFNLKNNSIPADDEIKKIAGVIGVYRAGEQYQVIIGQNVASVYEALCQIAGIRQEAPINENLDTPKEKLTVKGAAMKALDYISGSTAPLLPAMTGVALFKTLQTIGGPGMLNLFSDTSNFYLLCDFIYNGFFYFLPILLGFTAARKIGMNQVLGAVLGGCLLAPGFVALAGTEGATFSVYGIPAKLSTYGQTVLPILLTIPVAAVIYKFIDKHVSDMLKMLLVPFATILITSPLMYCLLAPLGGYLGDLIAGGLYAFGSKGGFIAVGIIGALWEFIVLTGMHQALMPIAIVTFLTTGVDKGVLVGACMATFAAYGMALGAFLRIRDKEEKSVALGYFVSGFLGGVTEPAIYGLGFKYRRPFIALMIGGFAGGCFAGIMGVGQYVMPGVSNFLSVLGFAGGQPGNIVYAIIACAISFGVTAVCTYLIGFSKDEPVIQK